MPEWLDIALKILPLLLGASVGALQLYLSARFAAFQEKITAQIDAGEKEFDLKASRIESRIESRIDSLQTKLETRYPARDILDLIVKPIEQRLRHLEGNRASGE